MTDGGPQMDFTSKLHGSHSFVLRSDPVYSKNQGLCEDYDEDIFYGIPGQVIEDHPEAEDEDDFVGNSMDPFSGGFVDLDFWYTPAFWAGVALVVFAIFLLIAL